MSALANFKTRCLPSLPRLYSVMICSLKDCSKLSHFLQKCQTLLTTFHDIYNKVDKSSRLVTLQVVVLKLKSHMNF